MPRQLTEKDLKRFWSKVDIKGPDECWNWKAYTIKQGYGQFWLGYMYYAPAISYMIAHGSYPYTLDVLHTCDSPSCVNPKHLFLGTHQDNMDDKVRKGRQSSNPGESNGWASLTTIQVIRIKEILITKTRTYQDIANEFKVHRATIWKIDNNVSWKHILPIRQPMA